MLLRLPENVYKIHFVGTLNRINHVQEVFKLIHTQNNTKIGNLSIDLYPNLITIRQVKYVTVIIPEKAWTGARAEYKDAYVQRYLQQHICDISITCGQPQVDKQ